MIRKYKLHYLFGLLWFVVGWIQYFQEPYGLTQHRLWSSGAILIGASIIWFTLEVEE